MESGQPSRTAFVAAAYRATHQVIDGGRLFTDPLAVRVLGVDAETLRERAQTSPDARRMRWFIAARTRFAEDALRAAVERGTTQLVILGAGLDTYAYRGELRERLRIFEVDHPATQQWKRERLSASGIEIPPMLTYAPVDFERETLEAGLANARFDAQAPTFFMWLGVVPYLTEASIFATLYYVANLSSVAEIVFDYSNPPSAMNSEQRADHAERAARVASLGEAWLTYFDSHDLRSRLAEYGFTTLADLGPNDIARRYFGLPGSASGDIGGHIVHARSQLT